MTLQAYSSNPLSGDLGNPLLGAAAAGAIATLLAMVVTSSNQDWSSNEVFQANMRKIHSAMLGLQCLIGGAQAGQPITDSSGAVLCAGGTTPVCQLSAGQLAQWRSMRDNFSKFWSETMSSITLFQSTAQAQGQQAKVFAADFANFYKGIQTTCAKQGATLPALPDPPKQPTDWAKYAVWGLGFVAVTALAVTAKSIFGGGTNISVSSAREEVGRRAQAMAAGIRERTAAAKQRMGLSELEAIKLKRIRVNADGYDAQGRQWGLAPVFKVHDNVLGHSQYVRARSPWEAEKIFNQNAQDLWQLKSR